MIKTPTANVEKIPSNTRRINGPKGRRPPTEWQLQSDLCRKKRSSDCQVKDHKNRPGPFPSRCAAGPFLPSAVASFMQMQGISFWPSVNNISGRRPPLDRRNRLRRRPAANRLTLNTSQANDLRTGPASNHQTQYLHWKKRGAVCQSDTSTHGIMSSWPFTRHLAGDQLLRLFVLAAQPIQLSRKL